MKIDEIYVWEAFAAVAKYGNFSKAAVGLRLPIPQLSKRVSKLEAQLGVRLFQRTTRVVTLTDEGRALLPRVVSILEDLNTVEASFENHNEISGTIRVASIAFVAQRLLLPVFSEFMRLYPKVRIELDLSEQMVHLVESNIDLAIRIQEPDDSSMVYRKLASNDLMLCATPTYLKASKQPLTEPKHLHKHALLMLSVHGRCKFQGTSLRLSEFADAAKFKCDNGWYLTELARNDFGVLVRSVWDVKPMIASGELVPVLKKYPLENFGSIYAVIPSRRLLAPRVRALLDFVTARAATWGDA